MNARTLLCLLLLGALPTARANEPEYYTLGTPDVPKLCNVTNAADVSAWAASNSAYAAIGSFWTARSVTAFPVERNKPDYYLGQTVEAPDGVDWDATYAVFTNDATISARFLFDKPNETVYVTRGETSTFKWVLADGSTNRVVIVATPIAEGRPKNIFWTDTQYGGRPVDLTGKFVQFFGPPDLLKVTTNQVSTGESIGGTVSTRDVISSGLYISDDGGKRTLYAAGQLEGQVVMAYYDSGTYERIVDVQTVQISRPSVEKLTGAVGSQLKPSGRGYDVTGLVASPTTVDDFDEKGPFLYQHSCENTLHDLHNAVFAIRPSDETTRNQTQIYWMETDNQGVKWPFEVDEYIVSWPTKTAIYVRGDLDGDVGRTIDVPAEYAVSLMKYQEDLGDVVNHATPPSGNVFTTRGPGLSLLKLSVSDDVWFVPIRSILRTDPDWYADCFTYLNVGMAAAYRGGSVSGLAEGKTVSVDSSVPGYIYAPASSRVWNPNLYSEDGTGATGCPSEVFAVTAPMDDAETNTIEVWWSMSYARDDMPASVTFPCLPQRYRAVWPDAMDTPDLVIASQLGSASKSLYRTGKALVFDSEDAYVLLPPRTYFSTEGGSILFWTSPLSTDPASQGASPLLTFCSTNGSEVIRFCKDDADSYTVDFPGGSFTCGNPASNDWVCLAFTWTKEGHVTYEVSADGVFGKNAKTADVASAGEIEGVLALCRIGAIGARKARQYRTIDNLATWQRPLTADELTARSRTALSGSDEGISSLVDFDGKNDLVTGETDWREAEDRVLSVSCTAYACLRGEPGAPRFADGILTADQTPTVYRQNDPNACGYNPNEEHAFLRAGAGGYVVWALRNDLNAVANVSRPGVLVEYVKDGAAKMQWYDVLLTNETYAALADACTAGAQLPGPHPFDLLDTPWMPQTQWDENAEPPYRDRKGQVWARCAGAFDIYMHYAQQDGFDWPTLAAPEVGASVPWLAYLSGSTSEPEPWHWCVAWPTNCPTIKIGQTLTTATGGLPEMWNAASMAVLYPIDDATNTVLLTDPTVAQTLPLGCKASDLSAIGLSTETDGGLQNYRGKYYFLGLPPALADRVYIDPSNDKISVIGKMEDNAGAVNMLHVNVLSPDERDALYGLGTNQTDAVVSPLWETLLAQLATAPVQPTVTERRVNPNTLRYECVSAYRAVDHYALTAIGQTNYVTLIENDATNSFCAAGNPINMHVIRVAPEYHTGRIVTRQDELNKLSQQLGIHYTEAFAGSPQDFIFDWRHATPNADGTIPEDYDGAYQRKFTEEQGIGRTAFTVGGQGDTLANMVNTYWICRYRAKEGTAAYSVMSNVWSAWCAPPALAEGWVQRVLNNITPYTQRMTDLYNNAVDTSVSMIRQAGAPYEGDVALNQDNLSSVGLIQLYRTILNKAESMSIGQGINDDAANKQLLLAAERLADLYLVLGDEAYADALNPTIGFGSSFNEYETGLTIDYGAASSSLFCFDNQVSTLLDEELALLRGRSCVNAPGDGNSPYFNRLVWNFTKGLTAGEVAYAVNYNISGSQSATIDASTAATLYPQGHGDAYGHYLSALQGYYRLLRHPFFSWGVAGMSEMNVADNVVNVDYYDEAKFAEAAADVAKVARRTVDLTALQHERDKNAGTVGGGYLDANATNAFGFGEWAVRGGFGALCNWAVANSLLPEETTEDANGAAYSDRGLLHIDRGTVDGIADLSDALAAIQTTCDRMDAGLNPLGLNDKAVPFDLTPLGSASDDTHFEQIRARAGKAFDNARLVLDRAQTYANRLRLISESEAAIQDKSASMEDDYNARLVQIYGSPYSDDIGPSGTYPQGYEGPDYYHYMWMDLAPYGLTAVADAQAVTTVTYSISGYSTNGEVLKFNDSAVETTEGPRLSFSLSANGLVVKPSSISGARPASSKLQIAYADFLAAYANVQQKTELYRRAQQYVQLNLDLALELQTARNTLASVEDKQLDGTNGNSESESIKGYVKKLAAEQKSLVAMQATLDSVSMGINIVGALGGIAGLAVSVGDAIKSSAFAGMAITYGVAHALTSGLEGDIANCEEQIALCENALERADRDYAATVDRITSWERASDALESEAKAVDELSAAWSTLLAAQEQVSAIVKEGDLLRSEREIVRRQYANNISKLRYNDMFFRKLSNNALARYDTAFDLARRYAFLAAKAYGYETGSPLDSTDAGAELLGQIVAARALGETDADGNPIVAEYGDTGLAAALRTLDDNWATLKTQLGINNPQSYATWYSLRHGLFRILSDETGDEAWATELAKYWVDDLTADAEFARFCQPFVSQFGLAEKEPGLVIPFETTIDFAYNLFGKPLAFDDAQPDTSYFATKIAAAGVWFEGFNEKRSGYTGASAFAVTPNVYLVPVGTDRLRVPGCDGEIADFDILDQTVPVPNPITAAEFAEANWLPSYLDGAFGGTDAETRLRRHPSFRAYFGARGEKPLDAALDATRLVGRSVWNTRWLLVIPAGTLNSDRDTALQSFIHGLDADRDGVIDVLPVRDIKIGFKTYSYGGK